MKIKEYDPQIPPSQYVTPFLQLDALYNWHAREAQGNTHLSACLCIALSLSLSLFLGPHPWHIEVPRPGVKWEPQPQPQQRRIRTASAAHTTAHGNAGSLTH